MEIEMTEVSEQEFKEFFSNRWFVVFKGFFENTKHFIIDGHYVGFKDEQTKNYKLDYTIVKKYKL